MESPIGQQLGRYHLLRLLGQGGFAAVYLAEHLQIKRLAAIKVLQKHIAGATEIEAFRKEAETVAGLRHPNIVQVFDFDVENGRPFLVMDYALGGSLRTRYPTGTQLSPTEIVPYVQQAAAALQYAHDRHIIHRDVKPENMLLGPHAELLLSDFGLAIVALHQPSVYDSQHMAQSQVPQAVAGTSHYLAPEQLQGQPQTASDQYALGIVVYEWLCGRGPFEGSQQEITRQHLFTPPPPLRHWLPDLPSSIEDVVLCALAKEPRQRFASVDAFADAFLQAAQDFLAPVPALLAADQGKEPVSQGQGVFEIAVQAEEIAVSTSEPMPEVVVTNSRKQQESSQQESVAEQLWKVPMVFTLLVGREREIEASCAMLTAAEVRLVTLLGVEDAFKYCHSQ